MMLPEKLRRTLEKIVAEMRETENIYGVGLFGSWGRGDAVASSDVDLLILKENSFSYEYVERIKMGSLLIDLNYIPKSWINGPIPPEIDQKIYEMQILYDRDWSLANMKILMNKIYASAERINIRTKAHNVESDIYLSRATSAFSKGDFTSAYLFATIAIQNMLKVLLEVTLKPFSHRRFLEQLENSAVKLRMQNLLNEYINMCGLNGDNQANVKAKLQLFKLIHNEMEKIAQQNPQALEPIHFKVRTKLKYYLNPNFLHGIILHTNFLLDHGKTTDASHYLRGTFLDIIENYAWLKSSILKVRAEYTTFMRSLKMLEKKNPKNYEHIIEFLNLCNVDKHDAAKAIKRTREIILKIRKDRKILIESHSLKG